MAIYLNSKRQISLFNDAMLFIKCISTVIKMLTFLKLKEIDVLTSYKVCRDSADKEIDRLFQRDDTKTFLFIKRFINT